MSYSHGGRGSGSLVTPDAVVHVVDDDEGTRNLLQLLLRTVGLQAETYALPSMFIDNFDPARPGCVVLDLRMPESNGVETLTWLRSRARAVPVIFVSGYADLATVIRVMKLGAVEFFEKARQAAPCIIFFDEIDALAPRRGGGGGGQVAERVVAQLLTELDGIEDLKGVVVLAATNRLDRLDPALLRAGRLEFHIALPAPDPAARRAILQVHMKRMPLAKDVKIDALVQSTEGLVGADLEGLCRQAALFAIREIVEPAAAKGPPAREAAGAARAEDLLHKLTVAKQHFDMALAERHAARSSS